MQFSLVIIGFFTVIASVNFPTKMMIKLLVGGGFALILGLI
jgi:hypothetical protein